MDTAERIRNKAALARQKLAPGRIRDVPPGEVLAEVAIGSTAERIRNKAALARQKLAPGRIRDVPPGEVLAEVAIGSRSMVAISKHDLMRPGQFSIRFAVLDDRGMPFGHAGFFLRGDCLPGFVEALVGVMEKVAGTQDSKSVGQASTSEGAGR